MLETVEIQTGDRPQAAIIWLHGLGADGNDFVSIVPDLDLGGLAVRFVFPHAPVRPVTINGGIPMRAWYDILGLDRQAGEDGAGIRQSAAAVETLVAREEQRGISPERVVLAGFSQGGAVALHTGLRHGRTLAGIMGLSTYLPLADSLDSEANTENCDTRIFVAHGTMDPVLPFDLGARGRGCSAAGSLR